MIYDIVLTPFPFDDFSEIKIRPAVVLSGIIGKHEHIVIAYISSQIDKTTDEFDILLSKSDTGFAETGLRLESVIKLHRLVAIPLPFVKKTLGKLPSALLPAINQKIISLFQLKNTGQRQ